jgi:phospholipid/cholesterol/gamma-HCH transport system substrate-binding protein
MLRKSTPVYQIGLFVLLGIVLLIAAVFLIGGKQKLFTTTSLVYAKFSNVSSLKTGAQVQMTGINVGLITKIMLPKHAQDSVLVTMKIEEDAFPLIHTDSHALITTEGLIGDKFILINVGGDSTRSIKPGATLQGEASKDFSRIYDTLNASVVQVSKLSTEAGEILKAIRTGQGSIGKLVYDDQLYNNLLSIGDNAKASMTQITSSVNNLGTELTNLAARINRGDGSVGKLLYSDDLYNDVKSITENLKNSSADLKDAMAKIALGSGRFAENFEALKHNFLFKGYFEDRGYWDAPEFEQSIDHKIDSLSHLSAKLEEQLRSVRMQQRQMRNPADSTK